MEKIKEFKRKSTDEKSLGKTINRLVDECYITKEKGEDLETFLIANTKKTEYILYNLAVHTSTGFIFAFDMIPIPLGSISRFLWTAGNRMYYSFKKDEKKEIHSNKVLLVSAIPWIGYLAYSIPLKQVSEDLCYVYANHFTYLRKNQSLESYLKNKPSFIREPLKRFLIPKYLRKN